MLRPADRPAPLVSVAAVRRRVDELLESAQVQALAQPPGTWEGYQRLVGYGEALRQLKDELALPPVDDDQ